MSNQRRKHTQTNIIERRLGTKIADRNNRRKLSNMKPIKNGMKDKARYEM